MLLATLTCKTSFPVQKTIWLILFALPNYVIIGCLFQLVYEELQEREREREEKETKRRKRLADDFYVFLCSLKVQYTCCHTTQHLH